MIPNYFHSARELEELPFLCLHLDESRTVTGSGLTTRQKFV